MCTNLAMEIKLEMLEEENEELKEHIIRLKAEKEQLYKALVEAYVGHSDDPRT